MEGTVGDESVATYQVKATTRGSDRVTNLFDYFYYYLLLLLPQRKGNIER
jgi:hypothetical protein